MNLARLRPLVSRISGLFIQLGSLVTLWVQQTLTYGAAITFEVSTGTHGIVTITDAVAFVMSAPTVGGVAPTADMAGMRIRYTWRNTSGGAHGAGTFNAIFKTSGALAAIATGFNRTYEFEWNGTNWIEIFRGAADVAN